MGPRSVALITGEEKIVPPRAHYFVCTVEAMPLTREVEFLAVDEIQLCADPERGHVFTQRLLAARGRYETMFLGAATMAPLVRRLLPGVEIATRERFSKLTYEGPKKITRLPRRTAVVAFSAAEVYAIAELIRRQRGGAAVVMGNLSPRTRNAQVALYQSGEVDFLVATDAIGMGLNMDLGHVAFAGLTKFDGKRTRPLYPQEIGQIAGRAGRFRRDGTFGVTGACEPMDEEVVAQVEEHRFEPVAVALWRNDRLDFRSLADLLRSLSEPAPRAGLKPSEEALDETTLRALAADPQVADRARDRSAMFRLWDACQTPDFRKTTLEDHVRLAKTLFEHLTEGEERVPDAWMAGQLKQVDRTDGEIDALSMRLANVRTLAYVANRPDWLADPAHWQGVTRALEDRLSRHAARKADGAFHRPAHQRADTRAGRRPGAAGRRRRRRRGDGGGSLRRAAERPRVRGRARRHHAGGQGAARRGPARGRAGDRPAARPHRRRARRCVRADAGRAGAVARRGGRRAGRRPPVRAARAPLRRTRIAAGPRARPAADRGVPGG